MSAVKGLRCFYGVVLCLNGHAHGGNGCWNILNAVSCLVFPFCSLYLVGSRLELMGDCTRLRQTSLLRVSEME